MGLNVRRVTKQFLVYGLGNISQTALSFLLLPLYMGYFAPEQYGVIAVLFLVVSLSAMVGSAGLMSALHRLYFTVEGTARRRLAATGVAWYLGLGTLIGAALVGFADPVARGLFGTSAYIPEVRLLGVYFLFNFAAEVPFNLLRLEERSVAYVSFSLVRFGVDFLLKLLLVIGAQRGVLGYLESGVTAVALTFVLSVIAVRRLLDLHIDFSHLRPMLRLGVPFIFSGFAMWSLGAVDRLLLNLYAGPSAVGLYAVGLKFSQIFNIVLFTPFSLLLPAIVFSYAEEHGESQTKQMLATLMNVLVMLGVMGYMAITLATKDLLVVFTEQFGARPEYLASASLVPVLTLVPLCYYLTFCSSYSLLLAKRPEYTSLAAAICAGLNVGLNLLLIPPFGAIGAAVATGLAYLVYVGVCYRAAQTQYSVAYDWLGIVLALGVGLSLTAGLWLIPVANSTVALLLRAPLGLALLVSLLWISPRPLSAEMRAAIVRRVRAAVGRIAVRLR